MPNERQKMDQEKNRVADKGRKISGKRDGIVGQQGAVWTRIAKGRESWGTLAEGFCRGKTQPRIEQNRIVTSIFAAALHLLLLSCVCV